MLLRIRNIFWEERLRLRDYLSVPYVLEAETVEVAPRSWIRRVAYPELPGCTAECLVVEDALHRLEGLRIEMIIRMVDEGRPPPVPRPPLQYSDPAWVARQAGLSDEIIALIDRDDVVTAREPKTNY
jgi:predicted RNase H-like HicB family nuclease